MIELFYTNLYSRHDIQNLRQENESFERQLSASERPGTNRGSASSDGNVATLSGCHIDGARKNSSHKGNILDPKSSEESESDGRF